MPKEYKLKKNYNHIQKINDDISRKLLQLYSKGLWYLEDGDNGFTLKQKFDNGKKTYIGNYGGPSSWTEKLFQYDIVNTEIYLDKSISFSNFSNGKYQENNRCSDIQYAKTIKFIIRQFYNGNNDDNIIWIVQNNRDVISNLLEYRIKNLQSISTFNNDIKIITRLMKILSDLYNDIGEFKELYHRTSQLQTDMNMILIERETGKNTLNRFENIINFEELFKVRDNLEKEWREQLDKNGFKNKSVWELHYKMLLLSAYTLTPCVRKELMGTKFAQTEDEMENISHDYVFVPPISGNVEYNFRICKKGKPAERYVVGYNENVRNKLSDLFRESLEIYKREYVFPKLKNMNEKSSVSNVSNILKNIVKGHTLGVNMLRSSYITWRNLNNVTYNDMKDDAIRLRNSVETQQRDYRKIVGDPNLITHASSNQNLNANNIVIRQGVDSLEKRNTYLKQYYEKNKNKIKEKQKEYIEKNKDILNAKYHIRLANGSVPKIPSKKIIEKYQLYQDTKNEWHTRLK